MEGQTKTRPTTRQRSEFILAFTKCLKEAQDIWGEDGQQVLYEAMHHEQPEAYLRGKFEEAFAGSS